MDQRGFAMYFSRASIPFDREGFKVKPVEEIQDCFLRHVGIYGYRAGFISKYIGCAFCGTGQGLPLPDSDRLSRRAALNRYFFLGHH
jgi:hypothetical protein